MKKDEDDYLYHVTLWNRLEAIAEDGLQRGRSRAIGASAYDAHAARGIFLTDADGVYFWVHRAEDFAEHGADDLLESGSVPVVLRVLVDDLPDEELEQDTAGTRDAHHDAWISVGPIEPDVIQVFDGSEWIDVSEWESVDIEPALKDMATDEERDEEDDPDLHIWVFDNPNPMIPSECTK
jgi:hypothetical protein